LSDLFELKPTKEGFSFNTDSGLTYFTYFTNYYLTGKNGEEIHAWNFGFYHEPHQPIKRTHDAKIRKTILWVIIDYFKRHPETGVLYLCRNDDGYARNRNITFNRWYKENLTAIAKFNSREEHRQEGLYSSLLIKADNPQMDYYVDAFYRTIDMFFPEAA